MNLSNEIIAEVETSNELIGEVETSNELIGEVETSNKLIGEVETSNELIAEVETSNELVGEIETSNELVGEVSIGSYVGTLNYNDLFNKPKINNVELIDNKSLDSLQIQEKMDQVTNIELDAIFSDL